MAVLKLLESEYLQKLQKKWWYDKGECVIESESKVVWCGVVWCGVVWCGGVWCGVVECSVMWCSVVWWSVV